MTDGPEPICGSIQYDLRKLVEPNSKIDVAVWETRSSVISREFLDFAARIE